MIRSGSLDALNAALSAAQGEFEAVSKTAENKFFSSKYAVLSEVVKAAAPILAKNGLAVWQGADVDDKGEVLWTVLLHSSGQYIGSTARLLPVKNDPQAQGSATTYQRRYQYMAALGLVADEDDDGNAASSRSKAPSQPKPRRQPTPPVTPAEPVSVAKSPLGTGSDGSAEDAARRFEPPTREIVNDITLEGLRETIKASGKSDDEVAWALLSVGVESLPANPSREDLKAAMATMTVDMALRFDAILADDDVPGSGGTDA